MTTAQGYLEKRWIEVTDGVGLAEAEKLAAQGAH